MSLRYILKFFIVILPSPAYLFYPVLPAKKMYHFMEHGIQRFLYRVIQNLRCNVQLIGSPVLPLPDLSGSTMPKSPRLGLHRNNGNRQFSAEKIRIQAVVNVF